MIRKLSPHIGLVPVAVIIPTNDFGQHSTLVSWRKFPLTSNNSSTQMYHRTILRHLSFLLCRCVRKRFRKVCLGGRVEVEVDSSTICLSARSVEANFTTDKFEAELTYLAGIIPTNDGPRPLYRARQPSSATIRLSSRQPVLTVRDILINQCQRDYRLTSLSRPCPRTATIHPRSAEAVVSRLM